MTTAEITSRYGTGVSRAVAPLSAPGRPGERPEDRRLRKEDKARRVEEAGGPALTIHMSDVLDNVVSWRRLTPDSPAWNKLPRWLWQARSWYLPLAERRFPEVAATLRREVDHERRRGVAIGSWAQA